MNDININCFTDDELIKLFESCDYHAPASAIEVLVKRFIERSDEVKTWRTLAHRNGDAYANAIKTLHDFKSEVDLMIGV